METSILGMVLALTSAVVWGGGDFTGGFATRRSSQYHVLALSAFSGLVVLVAAALVLREGFPSSRSVVFAMLAGVLGALGIAALYRALSLGHAASTAPTAAVISASIPVVYTALTAGLPAVTRLAGFGLAFLGIWLVSTAPAAENAEDRRGFNAGLRLAVLAGFGFGGFFLFLGLVEPGKVFTPLIIARLFTLATGLALTFLNRLPLPSIKSNPYALLAGVLDAGGNLFFILAKTYTRLDIATVLSAFYPASTILLAAVLLKEKVSVPQRVGVLLCLAAIALITV